MLAEFPDREEPEEVARLPLIWINPLACQHPNLSFQWICLAAEQRWYVVFALKDRLLDAAIQAAEERARETRRVADAAACEALNISVSNGRPVKLPSPLVGDAINAGYRYMEVKCDACEMHSIVDLTTSRRRKEMPVWQLDGRLRCDPCTAERGYYFNRGRLVRLRRTTITIE